MALPNSIVNPGFYTQPNPSTAVLPPAGSVGDFRPNKDDLNFSATQDTPPPSGKPNPDWAGGQSNMNIPLDQRIAESGNKINEIQQANIEKKLKEEEKRKATERPNSLVKSTGLTQFLSSVSKHGLVKNSKFLMVLTHPLKLRYPDLSGHLINIESNILKFYCHSVTRPSHDISTAPVRTQGMPYEMPYAYSRGGNTFTASFYVDRTYLVEGYFSSWIDLIVDQENFQMGYYADYIADLETIYIDNDLSAEDAKRIQKELDKGFLENLGDQLISNFKASATSAAKSKVKQKLGNSLGGKIFNAVMGDTSPSGPKQVRADDVPVVVVKYVNAYPKRISAINMTADGNAFVSIDVEFTFETMKTEYIGGYRSWVTSFKTKKKDNSLLGKITSAALGIVGAKVINTGDKIGGRILDKTINKL